MSETEEIKDNFLPINALQYYNPLPNCVECLLNYATDDSISRVALINYQKWKKRGFTLPCFIQPYPFVATNFTAVYDEELNTWQIEILTRKHDCKKNCFLCKYQFTRETCPLTLKNLMELNTHQSNLYLIFLTNNNVHACF